MRFACTLLILLFACPNAYGQPVETSPPAEAAKPDEAKDADKSDPRFRGWLKYYQQVADEYQLYKGHSKDSDMRLTVSDHPLMTYAHPWQEGTTHGGFFVWTREGCAEVIAAIWSTGPEDGERLVFHEFHSFSKSPLAETKVGRTTWAPTGVERKLIEGAGQPKSNAGLRLAQMKSLAREFTGYSTPHGKELKLRTAVQPVFRYDSKSPDVIDGAIFPMFAEWDPDIILLIEARKDGDDVKWYYAHGRFNGCPLRLEHNGEDVWNEGLVPLRVKKSNFFAAIVERRTLPAPKPDDE